LTPVGSQQKVGDMLLGCALSPDGKRLALVNSGYNAHHLYLVETKTGRIVQAVPLERAWNGVAWAADGATIYVSGGGSPRIHVLTRRSDGTFEAAPPIPLPELVANPPETKGTKADRSKGQAYVSGLALSHDGKTLFAANFATDMIYAIRLPDRTIKAQRKLETNAHPYCLRLSPDGASLYATQGAFGSIVVLNADDLTVTRTIATEKHPNDLLFAPDGRLFVSCGSSDSVLVINPADGQTSERIGVTLTPRSPAGTTPNALALSPDGKTLYVANVDNNVVAIVDVSAPGRSQVRGFLPTGWYPTAVCAAPDGRRLFVGSGKGLGTGANPPAKLPLDPSKRSSEDRWPYIGTLLYGLLATVDVPDTNQLAACTRQALANTPYRDTTLETPLHAPRPGSSPIPSRLGDLSPLKHVLYIIKENRTYDQVFGDIKAGNGDPNLTLFGEQVTPNLHALAREYVLLDNIYCNGEVSGNGHPWSTAAYGTDIGERAWTLDYSGRASWPLTDRDIYPPVGRIWDLCERKGLSWVSYYYTWTTDNTRMAPIWKNGLDSRRDFENADVFLSELRRYERENDLPQFMIMSLREDHTEGTTPGAFTPKACVASNDLGVGKIVEAFSRSRYWKETAIFIIQDDAQDGPDHVDAHRTEALVISPYTRRGRVDSTFYTTTSMLRTMELILGLPPMSQYDAAATPMYNAFASRPDLTPYTLRPARVDLMEKNGQHAYGARESLEMDFSGPDRLTARQVDQLNRILWHSIKGSRVPYPSPVRRALLAPSGRSVLPTQARNEED
jgi:YVTN family beta-propeller protein